MAKKPTTYVISVDPDSGKTVEVHVHRPMTSNSLKQVTQAVREAYKMGLEEGSGKFTDGFEAGVAFGQASPEKQQIHGPDNGDHFGH